MSCLKTAGAAVAIENTTAKRRNIGFPPATSTMITGLTFRRKRLGSFIYGVPLDCAAVGLLGRPRQIWDDCLKIET